MHRNSQTATVNGSPLRGLLAAALLLLPGLALAGAGLELGLEDAARLAVEHSPEARAAAERLRAAEAGVRMAGAPANPQVELAPGVGLTNGNALLSQEVDLFGRRTALLRAARGRLQAARADFEGARLEAAAAGRAAYFEVARAAMVRSAADETLALVTRIEGLVRRQVEIGEVPQVHGLRAEIEVSRARQEADRARAGEAARAGELNLLLGREAAAPLRATEALRLPPPPPSPETALTLAARRRPEIARARGLLAARLGEVDTARSRRRPELFAEVATDFWSLDRDPFRSRGVGIQARLAFPLFDLGRLRADVDRARAEVREQEATVQAVERAVATEVRRALAELGAARTRALGYEAEILPRSRALLAATERGFASGLTSFLEVLEAQRLLRQVQAEEAEALHSAARAWLALERATGGLLEGEGSR